MPSRRFFLLLLLYFEPVGNHSAYQAEDKLTLAKLDKEYLPITGLATFTQNAAKLAYGADSVPLNQNAVRFTSLRYFGIAPTPDI
jgi:aspartate/tyrosine/aromatic aminotransferase